MSGLRGLPARLVLGAVRAYQMVRGGHLSPCRFVPSCSEYAIEAVETHGACHGSLYALRRVLRCNPLGTRGFDPVPSRTR